MDKFQTSLCRWVSRYTWAIARIGQGRIQWRPSCPWNHIYGNCTWKFVASGNIRPQHSRQHHCHKQEIGGDQYHAFFTGKIPGGNKRVASQHTSHRITKTVKSNNHKTVCHYWPQRVLLVPWIQSAHGANKYYMMRQATGASRWCNTNQHTKK